MGGDDVTNTLVVPDLLYERELKQQGGARLQELGLRVEELSGEMLAVAVGVLRANPVLSAADCFALALAQANGWTLLTVMGRCGRSLCSEGGMSRSALVARQNAGR